MSEEILGEFEKAQVTEGEFEKAQSAGGLFGRPQPEAAPAVQPPQTTPEVPTPEQPPVAEEVVDDTEKGSGDTGEEIYDETGELIAKPGEPAPEDAKDAKDADEDDDDAPSIAGELAMSIPRGLEAAAEGFYGFLDYATGDDVLPDWDRNENSWLGKSQTTAGKMGEGLVQFGVGFLPGIGAASWLGRASKLKGVASALSKSKGALKSFSKNQLSLSPATMKKLSKLKKYTKNNMKYAVGGALSEFFVFKGQEQRLSNLLTGSDNEHSIALIEWLAYKPDDENKDKWWYEGQQRAKLALEGLIVGEVLGLGFVGVGKAYRHVKPAKGGEVHAESALDAIPEGEAALSYIQKILLRFKKKNAVVGRQLEEGKTPDEFQAFDEARKDPTTQPTRDETAAIKELEQRNRDAKGNKEHEEITGTKTSENPPHEGVEKAGDELEGVDVPEVKPIDADNIGEAELDDWLRDNFDMQGSNTSLASKRGLAKDLMKESKDGGTEHLIKGLRERVVKQAEETGLFEGQNPQSFYGAIRLIHSVPEMRALLSHIAKAGLKASKGAQKGAARTPQQLTERFEDTVELMSRADQAAGGKGHLDLEALRGSAKDLELVRADADAIYGGLNTAAKDLQKNMSDARTAMEQGTVEANVGGKIRVLNEKQAVSEMYSAMDRFTALQEIWGDFGRQMSLNMRQRNDLYVTGQSSIGRDLAGQHRNLGQAVEDAMKESGKRFRRESSRGVSHKRVIKDLEKIFKKSGRNANGTDVANLAKGMDDVGVGNALSRYILVGRKGLAVSQEWYYNAILGAPTSWVVNTLGGMLVMPLRHIESIAGGVMTGNMPLVKANFRVMFDLQSFSDSVKYAWKSGVDDEARSITGYTAFRDDRPLAPKGEIRLDNPDGNAVYGAINWLGHVVRHPTRIMMMGDEFFKQMSFRSRTKTALAIEGYQKGLHRQPGQLAKHIDDGFEALITKDGRFRNEDNVHREALMALVAARKSGQSIVDERDYIKKHMDEHFYNNELKLEDGTIYSAKGFDERKMLVDSGTDWALVNTFTNKVTNPFFKKTGEIATMSPWLGFIIPFVRTPSNILTFALGRTLPIGAPKDIMKSFKKGRSAVETAADDVALKGVVKKYGDTPEAERLARSYLKMIENESGVKAAEAMGRLSTGLMTMGVVFMNLEKILERVTGSPPKDPGKRAAWAATGKMPFAIEFNGKWHSYQRLDPFATTLGIMADISHGWADMRNDGVSEFGDEDEFEEKQAQFSQFAGVLATSFANNVSNKSYLKNLGELLDVLEKPPEAFTGLMGNILGGFVPNGLNWSQNVFQEEPAILEARGIMDKMMKRLPESMRLGKKLMPQRNGLGEVRRKSKDNTGDIRQNPLDLIKGINPLFSSDVSNDIVDIETENQAVGRNPMAAGRSIGANRIDYRSYKNDLGDTAYDRMQELSGSMKLGPQQLTLRQAMRATIESYDYQRLPPVTESNRHREHPRTKALTRIINIYRAEARRQTTGEYPKLRADLADLLK
tara:strand:- start:178 stop:4704 length:4527 start_codon:yes stop_codon:yes gene_type:complete